MSKDNARKSVYELGYILALIMDQSAQGDQTPQDSCKIELTLRDTRRVYNACQYTLRFGTFDNSPVMSALLDWAAVGGQQELTSEADRNARFKAALKKHGSAVVALCDEYGGDPRQDLIEA